MFESLCFIAEMIWKSIVMRNMKLLIKNKGLNELKSINNYIK